MRKRIFSGLIALLMLCTAASAEVFSGVTAAHYTVTLTPDTGSATSASGTDVATSAQTGSTVFASGADTGMPTAQTTGTASNTAEDADSEVSFAVEATVVTGQSVKEGELLAEVVPQRVFATQDGTVARILHDAEEDADGSVLELRPVSRYLVYCTVEEAKSKPENRTLRCGQIVYMRCTKNGTHRAVGRIYSIDGETYMVETTGGELYVGETVDLYFTEELKSADCIGVGTVVETDTEAYSTSGRIYEMFVEEGEYVERGKLLYAYVPSAKSSVTAPADGIVTAVDTSTGSVTIVPEDAICISVFVDEETVARCAIGDTVSYIYACDDDEVVMTGTIAELSYKATDDGYRVLIAPETAPERLGQTVLVYFN